ncbi:MAG: phage holin family protein [Bacteroidota bacterium]
MEENTKVERLLGNIKDYAETRFDIILLNSQEKVSNVLSSLTTVAVLVLCGLFVLLFASIGAAWLIGHAMHNPSIGFFIVGGFYLLITLLVFYNRDQWIRNPVTNSLLKKININEND